MQGLVKDRRGQVEIWNAGNHVAEDKETKNCERETLTDQIAILIFVLDVS